MISLKKLYSPENLNKNEIILDIETTGLDKSNDQLVLLGLITYEDDKCYIRQYFAEDDSEEKRLLQIYLKIAESKKIINYNGNKFDIPFLNYRLEKYKLMPIFPESYDIYNIICNYRKFFTFDSMKLVNIEKNIGIFRNEPSRYKTISKLTDDISKRDNPRPIMIHNENDLIATEKLANIEKYFLKELTIDLKTNKLTLNSIWINNDLAKINLISKTPLIESYFTSENYELRTNGNSIEIILQVIYGRFDKNNKGHVALNTFNIENESEIIIDPKLLIIRENHRYNYKNILKLSKKIIENQL